MKSDENRITLYFPAASVSAVERIFGAADFWEKKEGYIHAEYEAKKYGASNETRHLAKAGVPHICSWEGSLDLEPGSLVFDGEQEIEVNMNTNGDIVIRLHESGLINTPELHRAWDHMALCDGLKQEWRKNA